MSAKTIRTVLFLPAWYPTRNDNMGGIFVRAFGLALLKKVNVHVLHIAGQKKMKRIFEYTNKLDDGLETHILYYRKPSNKNIFTVCLEGLMYGIGTLLGYYYYRKQRPRPDIFHVFVLTRAAILPYILSLFSSTKYYITEVWSRYLPEDGSFNGFFRKRLAKKVVNRSSGITTVSLSLKNALIKHSLGHSNFHVINSVVPAAFFRTKLVTDKKVPVVRFLHVSCFDDYIKNISGMLNAFKMVQDAGFLFDLQLVGSGSDLERMKQYAQNLNLKNTEFSGKLTGDDLFEAFERANALVLFSNFETQGCVILEAHACGMPVIGSRTGGIPELISEDDGLLVEPGDENALANAIKKIINNYGSYNRQQIRNNAIANYSFENIASKFLNFYDADIQK